MSTTTPSSFKPLDPGRIDLLDPVEIGYWCQELRCTEAALRDAVDAAGTHVTAVREHLAGRPRAG